jgi:hypothetical protein
MNVIGAAIAAALWKLALAQWEKHRPEIMEKVEEFKGKIEEFIRAQFTEWFPKLIKATVVSMAQAAGQLTVNTVDKVTDVLPGTLDDRVLDPIVGQAFDALRRLGIPL